MLCTKIGAMQHDAHLASVLPRLVVHVEARKEALGDGLVRDLEDSGDERLRRHDGRQQRDDEHKPEEAGPPGQQPPERAIVRLWVLAVWHAEEVCACRSNFTSCSPACLVRLPYCTGAAHWLCPTNEYNNTYKSCSL